MTRKAKIGSNVNSYLRATGILEHGTHDQIQAARKKYWSEYKRKWRNEKRKKEKEFTISLDAEQQKIIAQVSKSHKLSRTAFMKSAIFGYINTTFIVPDSHEVKKISQLLAMTYNSIQELFEENGIDTLSVKELLERLAELEREVLPKLHNPKSLEEYIIEYICKADGNKEQLIDFINAI
ncbi:MAG TPA: hypothetical protein PLJ00_03280 [Chitinophagales bacterium]|nr:hypothetical protein [Chitinophagales bacterium]HRG26889.1 hypothetical protein [Chitinophagales bacterium]HRG85221.1 hypothetical protein [Chitinophagales bacterium]HRH51817.1 hypothetical protein [Chitinophagales bacterium]